MVRTGKAQEAVLDRCVRRVIAPVRENASYLVTVCGSVEGPLDPTPTMYAAGLYNQLLASGQCPAAFAVDLMVPLTMEEAVIKKIMQELTAFARRQHLTIVCGHTQVCEGIGQVMIALTMQAAKPDAENHKAADQMSGIPKLHPQHSLDLVMAGVTGQAGNSILAKAGETALLKRFPQVIVRGAQTMNACLTGEVVMQTAQQLQAVSAYAVSQGGVFGALWQMAAASKVGFTIDLKSIPIRQETIEICEWADLNPYQLYGVGAFLIVTENSEALLEALWQQQIPAALIGSVNGGNDRIVTNGEEVRYMDKPGQDMLWTAQSRAVFGASEA